MKHKESYKLLNSFLICGSPLGIKTTNVMEHEVKEVIVKRGGKTVIT